MIDKGTKVAYPEGSRGQICKGVRGEGDTAQRVPRSHCETYPLQTLASVVRTADVLVSTTIGNFVGARLVSWLSEVYQYFITIDIRGKPNEEQQHTHDKLRIKHPIVRNSVDN